MGWSDYVSSKRREQRERQAARERRESLRRRIDQSIAQEYGDKAPEGVKQRLQESNNKYANTRSESSKEAGTVGYAGKEVTASQGVAELAARKGREQTDQSITQSIVQQYTMGSVVPTSNPQLYAAAAQKVRQQKRPVENLERLGRQKDAPIASFGYRVVASSRKDYERAKTTKDPRLAAGAFITGGAKVAGGTVTAVAGTAFVDPFIRTAFKLEDESGSYSYQERPGDRLSLSVASAGGRSFVNTRATPTPRIAVDRTPLGAASPLRGGTYTIRVASARAGSVQPVYTPRGAGAVPVQGGNQLLLTAKSPGAQPQITPEASTLIVQGGQRAPVIEATRLPRTPVKAGFDAPKGGVSRGFQRSIVEYNAPGEEFAATLAPGARAPTNRPGLFSNRRAQVTVTTERSAAKIPQAIKAIRITRPSRSVSIVRQKGPGYAITTSLEEPTSILQTETVYLEPFRYDQEIRARRQSYELQPSVSMRSVRLPAASRPSTAIKPSTQATSARRTNNRRSVIGLPRTIPDTRSGQQPIQTPVQEPITSPVQRQTPISDGIQLLQPAFPSPGRGFRNGFSNPGRGRSSNLIDPVRPRIPRAARLQSSGSNQLLRAGRNTNTRYRYSPSLTGASLGVREKRKRDRRFTGLELRGI